MMNQYGLLLKNRQKFTQVSIEGDDGNVVAEKIEHHNFCLKADKDGDKSANQSSEGTDEETMNNKVYSTIEDDKNSNKKSEVENNKIMDCKHPPTINEDTSLNQENEQFQEGPLSYKDEITPNQLDYTWKHRVYFCKQT